MCRCSPRQINRLRERIISGRRSPPSSSGTGPHSLPMNHKSLFAQPVLRTPRQGGSTRDRPSRIHPDAAMEQQGDDDGHGSVDHLDLSLVEEHPATQQEPTFCASPIVSVPVRVKVTPLADPPGLLTIMNLCSGSHDVGVKVWATRGCLLFRH